MRWLMSVLLAVFFCSCSYTWRTGVSMQGKRFFYKDYKNYDVEQKMLRRQLFAHWSEVSKYSKFNGVISSDTTHGSIFIQFDSNRIYLFAKAVNYADLFTTGLLSPQMIYCALDSNCIPHDAEWAVTDLNGKPISHSLYGWTGNAISIGHIELLTNVKSKSTQRRFEIWVRQYSVYDAFFLE